MRSESLHHEAGDLLADDARHQAHCPGPADPRLSVLVAGAPVSLWWKKLQPRGGRSWFWLTRALSWNGLEMHNAQSTTNSDNIRHSDIHEVCFVIPWKTLEKVCIFPP